MEGYLAKQSEQNTVEANAIKETKKGLIKLVNIKSLVCRAKERFNQLQKKQLTDSKKLQKLTKVLMKTDSGKEILNRVFKD